MAEEKKIEQLNYREAIAKREELLVSVNDKYKEIGDERPTKEQVELVEASNKDLEIVERIISESKDFQEAKARHEAAYSAMQQGGGGAPGNTNPPFYPGSQQPAQAKTIGEQFADWKPFQQFVESKAGGPNRVIPDNIRIGESDPMSIDRKALIVGASATSAGALVRRDYAPLVQLPYIELAMRDIVTNGTTSSDLIEYPREVSRTNAAAPVAEATATAGASGTKPESSLVLEKVTAAVKTIAHWMPATKRALSDAGQIRTIIDAFLLFGLDEVVEGQILNGDGAGDNLLGLTNTPGVQDQPFSTDVLTTTRKARTKVEVVGLARPTAYVLNAYDWEGIELTKDGMGQYYYGGPQIIGPRRLWGLPVVVSPKQPQGAGFCGDFRTVVLWDREEASIRVSDSHADFFIRNLVAILAELRLAMGVFRPSAICEMDLFAGANS